MIKGIDKKIRVPRVFVGNKGGAKKKLLDLSERLDLPESVQNEELKVYKRAIDLGLNKLFKEQDLVVAVIYAVSRSRSKNIPWEDVRVITLNTLSEFSGVDKDKIRRVYYIVCRELGIQSVVFSPDVPRI